MPFDQERRDYLNEKYPRSGIPQDLELEFRNNSIDREVDRLMNDARNLKNFNDSRLMVPSDAELRYRANIPQPTNPNSTTNPDPLSEGLLKRDRPNPTPPTDRPSSIPSAPRTSPASPPPTPRTSGGAGNLLDMQSAPPTAAPRQSLGGPNPAPGAKPSGLPGPPGRLGYPAAGAAVDFAFRLGAGQPLGQAAAGSAGSLVGGLVGAAAGSALGPMGSFVGGMVGGYLGGMVGSALYNAAFPPTAEAPKGLSDPPVGAVPFTGGQSPGVLYTVIYRGVDSGGNNYESAPRARYGPIYAENIYGNTIYPGEFFQEFIIYSRSSTGAPIRESTTYQTYYATSRAKPYSYIHSITRNDGLPDVGGNPPPLPIPKDNRTPDSIGHPGNTSYAPPKAAPQITNITNNYSEAPPVNNYAPGGLKSKSGGNPRGDSPDWIPKGVPAPVPHPNYSPPPVAGLPGAAPSGSPSSTGAPGSNAVGTPNKSPFSFSPDGTLTIVSPGHPATTGNPTTNPADRAFPGVKPTTIAPTVIQPKAIPHATLVPGNFSSSPTPDAGTPSGLPTTVTNQPTPDAYRETPVVPAPTPTPTPTTPTNQPDFEELKKRFDEQALLLVGLTALLNPIVNNTTPEALRDAAETGTCRTLQPGGCMAPLAQNAANAANNSANNGAALSGLMAFLQALQATFLQPILAGINLINTKLGPVMAGADGIGGFLSRLSKSLGVDRALNLIAIAANLHNAMMLSASLKITLLEVLSSVGNATGLLQTSEGDNVDLNAVFNQGVEKFVTLLLGEENYASLKVGLRKYSAIYRAANNVLSNVGNMFSSIGNGIEVIGEHTGKIGNSIRAAGLVRENAYQWMAEKMSVHTNKFMTFQTKVGGVTEVLETINEIAESTIEGQQSYTEAVKATADFQKQLAESSKNPGIENKAIAEEAAKIKENLSKDPTGEKEAGYLSFLTD